MIVVKLAGGMGNQMFQYAMGKLVSLKCNKKLTLDLSFLLDRNQEAGFTYRDYDLDIFKLNVDTVNSIELDDSFIKLKEPDNHSLVPEFLNLYDHFPSDKNIYLSGYFQKYEYVKNIREQLLKDFELDYPFSDEANEILSEIKNPNSVCVNIRRTDYVTNSNMSDFHGVYGVNYINEAIEILTKKVTKPKFFIFSDDMEWCENNLEFNYDHVFVSHSHKGDRFGQYLYLMSFCKHFIIPNSTFAWWAAWLNKNENKMVISPQKWFKADKMDTRGLKPPGWISL